MNYCKCHETLTVKEAVDGLVDELKEFIEEPSRDEASDIAYCINRLAGAFVKKPHVKIVGGERLHIEKIQERMAEYGCIRSKRHLVDGCCPSEVNA